MPLAPQAVVSDVITECRGAGSGPFTVFNAPNITSGEVYAKITEANAALQQWTGLGSTTPSDPQQVECIKRYETNFAAAKLAADIAGIIITDGFNTTTGGISIQRTTAQVSEYKEFVKTHLDLAQWWIKQLHPWFYIGSPQWPEGTNEWGYNVTYWGISRGQW